MIRSQPPSDEMGGRLRNFTVEHLSRSGFSVSISVATCYSMIPRVGMRQSAVLEFGVHQLIGIRGGRIQTPCRAKAQGVFRSRPLVWISKRFDRTRSRPRFQRVAVFSISPPASGQPSPVELSVRRAIAAPPVVSSPPPTRSFSASDFSSPDADTPRARPHGAAPGSMPPGIGCAASVAIPDG